MDAQRKNFAEMNSVLDELRVQLMGEGQEAWGPDSVVQGDTSGGKSGELGAENSSNIWDAFDFYVGDMVDDLTELYELSDDDALDFIFTVADDLAAENKMPEIPDGDDEKAVARWLGVAGSMGFERLVLDAAEAEAEDSEE